MKTEREPRRLRAEHTPGPWKIWRDMDSREPLHIVGPSDDFTAIVAMENTQAHANARLIAAAPELLAVLDTLLYEMGHAGHLIHYPDRESQARAAIAKAKGAA